MAPEAGGAEKKEAEAWGMQVPQVGPQLLGLLQRPCLDCPGRYMGAGATPLVGWCLSPAQEMEG